VGGAPGKGVVVEGVEASKKALMLAGIHKNGAKNRGFRALIDLKIAQNTIFHSKVINKIYSQDIF
jgi:hypothetical protein